MLKGPRKYVISHINVLVYEVVMAGIIVLFYMTDHMFCAPFGSGTAEIFMIWTNFVRTNVAWTNVTVTVGI